MVYPGLSWRQSYKDADNIQKVYFIFNPSIYNLENLEKANDLIAYSLHLWYKYGVNNEKERYAVENLERQYYNNRRRIKHFQRFYTGEIFKLQKKLEKLSLI